ncbi:MAG: hypothetical protein LBH48_02795 [Bifidobacteriaceae bacterium]|nr:hypothetical protein [Bifidobacteriaceae bacterium]
MSLLVTALVGIGLVFSLRLSSAPHSPTTLEGYDFLAQAAKATNDLPAFQSTIQIGSESTLTGLANTMDITGVLDLDRQTGKASLMLTTEGNSQMDTGQDFNVTTQLFSDGENVYERAGTETKPSDMTAAQFREACDGYRIELFSPDLVDTQNVSIAPNHSDASTLVFYLSALPDEVLASVVEQYETLLDESVVAAEIVLTKAQFAYVVEDGLVTSQNIQISTKYQAGVRSAAYQTISEINLTQSSKDYSFTLPPLPQTTRQ